jgi:hypothetical protein
MGKSFGRKIEFSLKPRDRSCLELPSYSYSVTQAVQKKIDSIRQTAQIRRF